MEWHVTIAAEERRTLTASESELRSLVHDVARILGAALVLFSIVDEHVHLVLVGERFDVGRAVSGLSRSIARRRPLEPAHFRRVNGRSHLENLVAYLVRQPRHHHLDVHDALWSGTCFADLVGARTVPGFDPKAILSLLPRWRADDLWRLIDLRPPAALRDDAIRRLGAFALLDEADAAFAVHSDTARAEPNRRARQATAALGLAVSLTDREIAAALRTEPSVVREVAARATPAGVECLRRRLALSASARAVRAG